MLFKEVSKEIVKPLNHNKHEAQLNIITSHHEGNLYLKELLLLQKKHRKMVDIAKYSPVQWWHKFDEKRQKKYEKMGKFKWNMAQIEWEEANTYFVPKKLQLAYL